MKKELSRRASTEKIKRFAQPKMVKQVMSFLGLAGHFLKFIERFSIIAKPLTDLTKKDVTFIFGEIQ